MSRRVKCLLVVLSVLLSSCSWVSNFVVLNQSNQPLQVTYKVKQSPYDVFQEIGKPAKKAAADLLDYERHWRVLDNGEYSLSPEIRSVTVQVMPGEALRLEAIPNFSGYDRDGSGLKKIRIQEVLLNGAQGELLIKADEIPKGFIRNSESLYVLTYK